MCNVDVYQIQATNKKRNWPKFGGNLREIKKNALFLWEQEHTLDFNAIKQEMHSDPIPRYFNLVKPLLLQTYANYKGLGVVLHSRWASDVLCRQKFATIPDSSCHH